MCKDNKILSQIVFDEISVSDLLKDIYASVKEEDKTIKKTIEAILSLYSNNDAKQNQAEENLEVSPTDLLAFVAPIIKDFMEVSIKNKKQLIDLVSVIQRLLVDKNLLGKGDSIITILTDEERETIIKNVKKETEIIQNTIFDIDSEVQDNIDKVEK